MEVEEQIKKAIQIFEPYHPNLIDSVILFGSRAAGSTKPDSDIDLLVVRGPEAETAEGLGIAYYSVCLDINERPELTMGKGKDQLHIIWAKRDLLENSPEPLFQNIRATGRTLLPEE